MIEFLVQVAAIALGVFVGNGFIATIGYYIDVRQERKFHQQHSPPPDMDETLFRNLRGW